ncbi:hypothetical protein [uncultured Formosa sp.]|uniref:hypothetical protein n=1 Tax=uncultured Formosa sp. TaxID=255435 RepID=UPI0026129F83|nr:hypothetical protein [uncultured Formosa sp.]
MLQTRIKILKSSEGLLTTILNSNKKDLQAPGPQFYSNPMYFHIFLIVLILLNLILSQFNIETFNDSYYDRFYDDLVFQFNVAILFTIIGVLNPFLELPKRVTDKIKDSNHKFYLFLLNKTKLFYSRVLACILVILCFIYKDWLVFSNFFQDNLVLKGIDIALVVFVLSVTYRMITYAKSFLLENIFRVIKTFSIVTTSLFILVPLVPLTLITLFILDIDERTFNFMPIPFIGFNLIMVYVEYSLHDKQKTSNYIV